MILLGCSNKSGLQSIGEFSRIDTVFNSKDLNLFAAFNNSRDYQFIAESNGKLLEFKKMKMFPSGLPKFEKFSNHWVYLKGGCGSSCFYAYLIPINVNGQDSIKTYMFPILVNQEINIIIYCSDDTIVIENYLNGKFVTFSDERLVGPYCGFSIREIKILGGNVILEINSNKTLVVQTIDITSLI